MKVPWGQRMSCPPLCERLWPHIPDFINTHFDVSISIGPMYSTEVSLYDYSSYFSHWFWMYKNDSVIKKTWQWWNMGVKCLPKTIEKNCGRDMNSVIIIIKIITFHLHSTLQQNDFQSSFQMVLGSISWMSPRERLLGWDSAADNIVLRLS